MRDAKINKKKVQKNIAIILWCFWLTNYAYCIQAGLFDYLHGYIITFLSIVIIGTWWNYISKLYNEPIEIYENKHLHASLCVFVPIIGLASSILSAKCEVPFNKGLSIFFIIFYAIFTFITPWIIISIKDKYNARDC